LPGLSRTSLRPQGKFDGLVGGWKASNKTRAMAQRRRQGTVVRPHPLRVIETRVKASSSARLHLNRHGKRPERQRLPASDRVGRHQLSPAGRSAGQTREIQRCRKCDYITPRQRVTRTSRGDIVPAFGGVIGMKLTLARDSARGIAIRICAQSFAQTGLQMKPIAAGVSKRHCSLIQHSSRA